VICGSLDCDYYIVRCKLMSFATALSKFHKKLENDMFLRSETSVTFRTTFAIINNNKNSVVLLHERTIPTYEKVYFLQHFCFRCVFQIALKQIWASASHHGILHVGRPTDQRSSHRTHYTGGMDISHSEICEIWLHNHHCLSSRAISGTDIYISRTDVQRLVPFRHCQQSRIRAGNFLAGNSLCLLLVLSCH
jgi:hypothetical protein